MSETTSAAGVIHAGDMEGTRLCGAVDGLKTVFRSPGSVTCFDCLTVLADERVERPEPGPGELHVDRDVILAELDGRCPVCSEPADDVEWIVDAAGVHLTWIPCRHESEFRRGAD